MTFQEALERATNFIEDSEATSRSEVIRHLVDEFDCDEELAREVVEELL